jgi:adenosyl cobinamide kinase/adenosyl cobinamide phosphate guanylyltransferase
MQNFNDTLKIKINKHDKKASQTWKSIKYVKEHQKQINSKYFNVAVLTGKVNNIIVVDIDKNDDGTEEYKKYEEEFGQIKTLKQNTPIRRVSFIF